MRQLSAVSVANDSATAGEVVEVGTRDSNVGTLRRDLNKIGERVEEVTELTVLNKKRLR